MREVNFSIPNVNKASVYITATLYDRRALDCTSTLPLINSLNHLAYLTTSSARIRDILTVDGGVERLICILKEGRSKDDFNMWKWNLAFQCIVNIGVRGTEPVRTRVVEADMVPVIATILYDYLLVMEREKANAEKKASKSSSSKGKSLSHPVRHQTRELINEANVSNSFYERQITNSDQGHPRRQAPPAALEIQPFAQRFQNGAENAAESTPTPPIVFTSPPERTSFARPPLTHQNRSHEGRPSSARNAMAMNAPGPATAVPSTDTADMFSLRPVRDIDRLPSMVHPLHTGVPSNPESPTTPSAPLSQRNILLPIGRRLRRPSIRHQLSNDDVVMEDVVMQDVPPVIEEPIGDQVVRTEDEPSRQPLVEITTREDASEEEPETLTLTIPANLPTEDTVDIAQQTPTAATALATLLNQPDDGTGDSPAIAAQAQQQTASPAVPLNPYTNFYPRSTNTTNNTIPTLPRDDDVLMGLQLLAYISKYCDLRHYFQATHLVPRLRIDRDVEEIYGPLGSKPIPEPTEEELEEYLQPDDYNIFPLVERFTVPVHSKDMQYWACVVMRNLCRKDDQKGGIRQCASYICGKWEEFPRQFAKCRRCRRTKYCSKECQRESWSMHRHWCQAPPG